MKGTLLLSGLIMSLWLLLSMPLQAQVTITAGPKWQDVMLVNSTNPGETATATTNYNNTPRLSASTWTHSGSPIYYRSLIRFDLDIIPPGAIIQSASLYLYSDPAYTSGEASNVSLSGSNAVYFQRITQPWNESSVTWNTQPTTTPINRIWVGPSTSATENIQVNLTTMTQEMVNNPSSNYGVMMILENEAYYRSRSYASANHSTVAIRPKIVITYTVPDAVKQRMDYIFGALNQSDINTGILTDYGMDLIDQSKFDGVIRANNIMDMNSWRALYGSMLTSVINPSSNLIHLKTINQRLQTYWATYNKNNPIVDLPALFVSYQSLRSDALSQNLLSVSNERLYDVASRTQSPYTTSYAFAAAPNIEYDKDGKVTFMFRSDLFVNSSPKTLSSFSADFNNGAGYQAMSFNTPKIINYTSAGVKNLKFKIAFTDGSIYYSHANFTVVAVSAGAGARYDSTGAQLVTFPRATAAICPEAGFANPEAWQGSFYGASVTVEYGDIGTRPAPGCNPQFIRPLIVIEGYDASKFGAFGITNWSYGDFVNRGTNGALFVDVDPTANILRFGDRLEDAGYDLIFVDLNEGTGDIIRNAYLLENIIRWVNAHKINNPNTGIREGNVVLGQSMGGLIARYAVCDMEKRQVANPATNPAHEVRMLITQDTPHRGANVPLGLQAMVNELAPYRLTKIGLVTYGVVGAIVGTFFEMKDLVPALDQADQLLDEPASQQMLIVQDGRSNTFLDGPYRNMVTFNAGYTPTFQMRALSNGSECGNGALLQPGGEVFFAEANLYVNRLLFSFVVGNIAGIASIPHGGLGVITLASLGVLTPFTGKNWKTKFIVRAAPSSGTNEAFYGKIGFEKKVLVVIPVTIPLFTRSRTSQAGSFAWDSAPGGYYDLTGFRGDIPDDPNINAFPIVDVNLNVRLIPAFTFVPTLSALDIAPTPIPVAALTSPYANGINPTYPSRFANFISQEQDNTEIIGSIHNSRHIQFTPDNANWIFNEMQNTPNNTLNCSTACNPYASFTIAGTSPVCNSQNFSIPPIAGATYNWITSSNLTITGGQNTSTVTVRVNGSGTGTISLNIVRNGCSSPIQPRSVQVGNIVASQLHIYLSGNTTQDVQNLCPNNSYALNAVGPSGTTFSNWTFLGNFSSASGSGNTAYVSTGSNFSGGSIAVIAADACGASVEVRRTITTSNCSFSFKVYPNPVDNYVEVELIENTEIDRNTSIPISTSTLEYKSTLVADYVLTIYDKNGNKVKTIKTKDKKVKVTIDELPADLYYLQVIHQNQTQVEQLIIGR